MTDTATVDEAAVPVIADETVENVWVATETFDEPATVITDELVRSLALKLNPFVKVGREPPVTNLRPSGFMADVVESLGWPDAERTFPEVSAFLGRLRETLEELVAGA